MAGATFRWNGQAVAAGLQTAIHRGLQKAAEEGRNEIVRAIGTSSRAPGPRGLRRPSRKRRGGGRPMQFARSKPGEPPHRDTGALVRSIFSSADRAQLMATVGTTLKYGVYLEKGASVPARVPRRKKCLVFSVGDQWVFTKYAGPFKLAARPYVWSTLNRIRGRIMNIIAGEVNRYLLGGGK